MHQLMTTWYMVVLLEGRVQQSVIAAVISTVYRSWCYKKRCFCDGGGGGVDVLLAWCRLLWFSIFGAYFSKHTAVITAQSPGVTKAGRGEGGYVTGED